MFARWYATTLAAKLQRPFVHIVFGARQTGKSTLIRSLLPEDALRIDLSNPSERSRYLMKPEQFIQDCKQLPARGTSTVFIDEVQTVPRLFDAVQHLYDQDKQRWRFILCGSSARKLRRTDANMLPGRSFIHRLFPLTLAERPAPPQPPGPRHTPSLAFDFTEAPALPRFPATDLITRLAYGELPGIAVAEAEDRAALLSSYAVLHLEEEIRRESLVRDWGLFQRFLRLAAAESGQILNYTAISNESGLAQPTVKSHYQLLEDMFLGFTIPAWTKSSRKQLLATPRFMFMDVGLRHAAAGFSIQPAMVEANPGPVFEQWVGIELWKRLQYLGGQLYYMRTKDGAEIDFITEHEGRITPYEVKWTENPTLSDARHLRAFLAGERCAAHGYIICRCLRPMALAENITALPWYLL